VNKKFKDKINLCGKDTEKIADFERQKAQQMAKSEKELTAKLVAGKADIKDKFNTEARDILIDIETFVSELVAPLNIQHWSA